MVVTFVIKERSDSQVDDNLLCDGMEENRVSQRDALIERCSALIVVMVLWSGPLLQLLSSSPPVWRTPDSFTTTLLLTYSGWSTLGLLALCQGRGSSIKKKTHTLVVARVHWLLQRVEKTISPQCFISGPSGCIISWRFRMFSGKRSECENPRVSPPPVPCQMSLVSRLVGQSRSMTHSFLAPAHTRP